MLYNGNAFTPLTGARGLSLSTDNICVPGLNCQYCSYSIAGCPLGLTQRALAGGVAHFAWTLWGLLVLLALIFGRTVCGWLCPVGFLQDILAKTPLPKLRKSKITYTLSYLKYVVGAIFVLIIPFYTGYFTVNGIAAFCIQICPVQLLEVSIVPAILHGDWVSIVSVFESAKGIILALLLVTMLLVYRPFCRFICPLGAFYGFFNKFCLVGIRVDQAKCVHCGLCAKYCSMDTKLAGDHECISCGNCRELCPKAAISFDMRKDFLRGKL